MSDGWFQFAACRGVDPDLFYPYRNGTLEYSGPERARIDQAKAVCARCSVVGECLAYAIRFGECHGVWGGLLPEERGAPAADLRRCDRCGSVFVARNRLHGLCGAGPCRQGYKTAHQRATRERNL